MNNALDRLSLRRVELEVGASRKAYFEAMQYITRLLSAISSLLRGLFGAPGYRPEKHYMRGPGPKSRGKSG